MEWIERVDGRTIFLSAVTMAEIQSGIEITREQDPDKARELQAWADMIMQTRTVLPMDGETFRLWARLMHRKPDRLYEDAMIAATARQHGLSVVTWNVKDFGGFDVEIVNPFVEA